MTSASDKNQQTLRRLAENNLLFTYPRIVSLSIRQYPENFVKYDELYTSKKISDLALLFRDNDQEDGIIVPFVSFYKFVSLLADAVNSLPIKVIVFIDLRGTRVIDKTLIQKIKNLLIEKKVIFYFFYNDSHLTNEELEFIGKEFVVSSQLFELFINNFLSAENNAMRIKISGTVSLRGIDEACRKINTDDISRSFLNIFDFSSASSVSFFSINMLSVLMHSYAHQYGSLSDVALSNTFKKMKHRFDIFRFWKINKYFLLNKRHEGDCDIKAFGIYLFNRTTYSQIVNKFGEWLRNISELYPQYFNRYLDIQYEYKGSSYRDKTFRQTYANIIRHIASELIENAARHSKGVGYFSFYARNSILYMFIGDCGVGLANGILANYDLEKCIVNDKRALKILFQLYHLRKRRKTESILEAGGGEGLISILSNIFNRKGKLFVRTGNIYAAFLNPIMKHKQLKTLESSYYLEGTQFLIALPLTEAAIGLLPQSTDDFLGGEI